MMHRYPGPRSFTGDDRHLFFGRDAEKQELFRLIVLNDLVVLFGESGTGKTSLLQAGVCPALEEQQYKPVFIRLNNTKESPELQVCHQLKEGGYIPADMPEDRTLWEYFSRFWYVDLGEVYTPVVVFDQFEELFTLYQAEERANFIEQFAAIANRRPPAGLSAEAVAAPQAKFVFSLRSDFLYLLDELSADIPAILRCRFQLRLLDRNGASDAIIRPAAMSGEYASPNFVYSTAALEGILGALSKVSEDANSAFTGGATSRRTPTTLASENKEIAAFQLQMVCRQLEEKIIRQKRPAGFQVAPDFYGGTEGIRQIIEDFYHQVLEKIAPTNREAVEKLLARGLIRNGRRIMMEASAMREGYGVSQAVLELLHDERLLKREARKGELYYEISHDTLVKPVLERFKKIEVAEREAEAERLRLQAAEDKRRADEAERLKNEAITAQKAAEEEKRKAQKMTFFAIGLAGLASLATLGAGYMYDQADKEKTKAEAERNEAQRSDSLAQKALWSDSLAQVSRHQALNQAILEKTKAVASEKIAQIEKAKAQASTTKARNAEIKAVSALEEVEKEKHRTVSLMSAVSSGDFCPFAICRVISANKGVGSGFIVKGNYLFTANHVIPDKQTAISTIIEVNYFNNVFNTNASKSISYSLDTTDFIFSPIDSLNFTRVKIIDKIESPISKWGFLRLDTVGSININDQVLIVHHPLGEQLNISPFDTKIIGKWNLRLFYSRTTKGGSSGAPILDKNFNVIALHEGASDNFQINNRGDRSAASRGIQMKKIVEYIKRQPKNKIN